MGALALDGKIRTFAGDEEKPLSERRFFSAQEARQEIEELVGEHFPILAGEGNLYFNTSYPSRRYLDRLISGGQFFGLPQRYLRLMAAMPTLD